MVCSRGPHRELRNWNPGRWDSKGLECNHSFICLFSNCLLSACSVIDLDIIPAFGEFVMCVGDRTQKDPLGGQKGLAV